MKHNGHSQYFRVKGEELLSGEYCGTGRKELLSDMITVPKCEESLLMFCNICSKFVLLPLIPKPNENKKPENSLLSYLFMRLQPVILLPAKCKWKIIQHQIAEN